MLMTEIYFKEAAGRTVKAIHESFSGEQIVIVFDDGSFTTIGVDVDWRESYVSLVNQRLKLLECWGDDIVNIGIVTNEYLEKIKAEKVQKTKRDEFAHYLALKEKFEGK